MIVVRLRSFLLNIKDSFQSVLLFVRSNADRLHTFNASAWGMTLKSIFSIVLLALVILQIYNLFHTKQFGLDKIFPLLGSLTSALLNNTSTFGGFITMAMHVSFVAGPWLLLASMIVGICQQTSMLLYHSYQAFRAQPGSIERKHHLQAAAFNVFNALLITSMMMTVIFGLLFPGTAPVVLITFTVIAITMLAASIFWRNISHNSRLEVKQQLGFGKPAKGVGDSSPRLNINSSYENKGLPVVKLEKEKTKFGPGFWLPEVVVNEFIELEDFSEKKSQENPNHDKL